MTEGPTILVVDDDDANRYAVSRTLTRAGYEVTTAASGAEALEKATEDPDLILLDIQLPDIDGFEVCRRLRADDATASIAIVHLTAHATDSADRATGLEEGADAYLTQPVRQRELLATVAAMLRLRRAEREAREHARELELADERKNEFLAMLAHELRTPLGALSVASEVLEEIGGATPTAVEPQAERAHATIRRQVGNLSRMVDDLLDVSRITQGKVELRKRRIDLNRCVANVADSMKPVVDGAQHELAVSLADDALVVDADPTRCEQIAWNLIDNAVKYTSDPGRITIESEAVTRDGRRWAELRVMDTGAGIPADRLGDVFGLFVQFDRTLDRSRGGLGLGLTLVRRLAEMHGGEVEAQSPGPGRGSTFIVRLPLLVGAEAQASDSTPPPERIEKRRILLAEDNEDLRELTAWKLRRRGYEVVEAGDGAEALEAAQREPPDIALVDLGLPRMDGLQLAEALRGDQRTGGVYLIALTGYGSANDMEKTRAAGFHDHVVKPVDMDELMHRLDKANVSR